MRRVVCVVLGCILAAALTTPAAAASTIVVTASCAYSGGQFAVVGRDFDPSVSVALEIMPTRDPLAGDAIVRRSTTADATGSFLEIFDVPPISGMTPVVRSVRARPSLDAGMTPVVMASASVRTVARGVRVSAGKAELVAGAMQRWRLTGLPEQTALYAHYRRRGRTVARRSLGRVANPCGGLEFDLRLLPRGAERTGAWVVWMTADRTFRRPRKGVYVRRRLTASGSNARARVRAGAHARRLTPVDPRFVAPVTNGMAADASQIGLISLTFVAAQGATVEFLERVGDRLLRLGTSAAQPDELVTPLEDATTWSCDRVERHFMASATLPSGAPALASYSVRTPSCMGRFRLAAPRRVAAGQLARVGVVDRWRTGAISPTLCVTSPAQQRTCRRVVLARAVTAGGRRFRATLRGDWLVQLRVAGRRVAGTVVRVGGDRPAPTRAPLTVLATGDSTMQGIDGVLADELGDTASVVSDVRIGGAISRSGQQALPGADDASAIQWAQLAAEQTARLQQNTTVVSIGANEGFPMTVPDGARVLCCDAAWASEYSRRARLIMQAYARADRRRVLWLTLPLPRDERRLVITRVVNEAILGATAGLASVKVLRMDLAFTPDGYRDTIRHRGRDVDVRDVDGIHLNVAGTSIAATIVAQELRNR